MNITDDFINTVTAKQFRELTAEEKHTVACELTSYDEDENIPETSPNDNATDDDILTYLLCKCDE